MEKTEEKIEERKVIKTVYCGKYLSQFTLDCKDPKRVVELKDLDSLKREEKVLYDDLVIVPIFKFADKPKKQIFLISELRPAMKGVVLAFPPGVAEADIPEETKEEAANKEKAQESYDEPNPHAITAKVFVCDVNGDDECNKPPKINLEKEEGVKVHFVDMDSEFLTSIMKLAEQQQLIIHDKLYFVGNGLF